MSYTPTEWQTGDTITAAGLNKMEQGIASASSGGGSVVSFNAEYFYDPDEAISRIIIFASPAELLAAFKSGAIIIARGVFTSWGATKNCTLYFCYAAQDFSDVAFYGYEPNSESVEVLGFYPDASGETMSTDGGYVP